MTPTLRKLYHRRGKHLDCIAEIDKKIAELTPEFGDLIVYDNEEDFYIGIYHDAGGILTETGWVTYASCYQNINSRKYLTILEKGFER